MYCQFEGCKINFIVCQHERSPFTVGFWEKELLVDWLKGPVCNIYRDPGIK